MAEPIAPPVDDEALPFQRPVLRLTFPPGSEFAGLVIRSRRFNIDELTVLATVRRLDINDPEVMEQIRSKICPQLGGAIISWNYHDELGFAVPADEEGIRRVDIEMLYAIVRAITGEQVGVAPPLPQPSADGDRELAESMPMEFPSTSPENSSELIGS